MQKNLKVLDISHHNSVESWAEIEAAGVVGIIHKATEGHTFADDMYVGRYLSADRADTNLLFGAYHFLRPGDMIAQAQHFIDVAGIDPAMIYAADHEDPGVSLDDLKAFLGEVAELTDKPPIIYSGHVLKEQVGGGADPELAGYRLWLAHYADTPTWPTQIWKEFWLWQYSSTASCPGMNGAVDANHYEGTDAQLIEEWLNAPADVFEELPLPAPLVVTVLVPEGVEVRVITQGEN